MQHKNIGKIIFEFFFFRYFVLFVRAKNLLILLRAWVLELTWYLCKLVTIVLHRRFGCNWWLLICGVGRSSSWLWIDVDAIGFVPHNYIHYKCQEHYSSCGACKYSCSCGGNERNLVIRWAEKNEIIHCFKPSTTLTQEEMPERIWIVQRASTLFITNSFPYETRRIDYSTIDYRARHISKQTDGELNDAHGHCLVCWLVETKCKRNAVMFCPISQRYTYINLAMRM